MAQIYPRWRFHQTLGRTLVKDPVAEAALGPGWGSWADIYGTPTAGQATSATGPADPPVSEAGATESSEGSEDAGNGKKSKKSKG